MVDVKTVKQAFKNLSPAAWEYCRQTGLEHFVSTSRNTKNRMMSGLDLLTKGRCFWKLTLPWYLEGVCSAVFGKKREKSIFFLWFRLTSALYQGQHNSFTGIPVTQSCRILPLCSCVGHSVSLCIDFPHVRSRPGYSGSAVRIHNPKIRVLSY